MSEPTEAEERQYRMRNYARNVTNSGHYHVVRLVPSEAWLAGYFTQVVEAECSVLMAELSRVRLEQIELQHGKRVTLPCSREHANAMLAVAGNYLKGLSEK